MYMDIKHTHPAYDSEDQRLERLLDIYRACMEALSALRTAGDRSGGEGPGT